MLSLFVFFLFVLAILVIIAFLYPYVVTYAIASQHDFRPMHLESADPEHMPSEIGDLMQPWIDRLSNHNFDIVSYKLIHSGLINEEPLWGVVLQHSSKQFFVGLMVKPKPDIHYPLMCIISSYWQETNITSINVKDFSTYSKTNLEIFNYLDRANPDELWLSHQNFLNSICSTESLERMTVDEWTHRLESTSRELTHLRVRRGEAFWTNQTEMIHKKNPWLVAKMIAKIGIDRMRNNRATVSNRSY